MPAERLQELLILEGVNPTAVDAWMEKLPEMVSSLPLIDLCHSLAAAVFVSARMHLPNSQESMINQVILIFFNLLAKT